MEVNQVLQVSLAFLFSILLQGASSVTFTIKNNCPYTVWPATLSATPSNALPITGLKLDPGLSISLPAPPKWSGRIWARKNCSADSSGKFSCLSADCGTGKVECDGAGGSPPASLAEFTLQGADGKDFYDTSLVDGYNLPVSVVPLGVPEFKCNATACPTDVNLRCPPELQAKAPDGSIVGCKSACLAFDTDEYCCRGRFGGPENCRPTKYSEILKDACPLAYSYAYDDASSTFTCIGADYLVTFCP